MHAAWIEDGTKGDAGNENVSGEDGISTGNHANDVYSGGGNTGEGNSLSQDGNIDENLGNGNVSDGWSPASDTASNGADTMASSSTGEVPKTSDSTKPFLLGFVAIASLFIAGRCR